MRDVAVGTHWALAGARAEYSAGNGAAMRIAPLAFLLDPDDPSDRTIVRDVCRITHHHDEAYLGALAVMLGIRQILAGTWSEEHSFLQSAMEGLPDSAIRDRIMALLPLSFRPSDVAARFGASGFVVDSVPLALYCAQFIASQPLSEVVKKSRLEREQWDRRWEEERKKKEEQQRRAEEQKRRAEFINRLIENWRKPIVSGCL